MLYNDAYYPILGTKHPKAMGQRGEECWAEIWDVVGPMLNRVLTTGEATWSENQLLLIDRNGYIEECYFTFSYSPITDETGGIGGVFTAVTETTAQVIRERRLQTLRDLASNTAQAKTVEEACQITIETLSHNEACIPFALLYQVEKDGKSACLVAATGLAAGTPAVQGVDLIQGEEWQLGQVQETGKAQIVEDLTARFGGLPGGKEPAPNTAIVLPLAKPGFNPLARSLNKQQVTKFLVLAISPRRALDLEYCSFFELVAGNVTTAIANAEACVAERQRAEALAELDRAKTTFFSNISHEFRTPLTLMLGPAEDALADVEVPLPPRQRERIDLLHRNGLRLLKLVNTLLDFSRIEAGRVQVSYEPTDLATFTAELSSVFRSAIERAGMHLQVNCSPLPERVYVDREMWEKIVLNLLSNAFKFTFEGEISVALRWCKDHVELDVQDTGTGIPAAELPHLFKRFHRVQGAKGRTYEGSGIGLSLVQELVKLHQGKIEVSSRVNEGTLFRVSIPTGYAHLPNELIGATRSLASTATGATPYVEEALRWLPESKGIREEFEQLILTSSTQQPTPSLARILLADDNADMRDYVKRLLSQQYTVEAVSDGVTALNTARQQLPDLILSDVMMPGLDGFELLRELRADSHTRNIPIILLSARAGEESRIEGLEAGADDYLSKPFSARELLVRVETTLKLSRMRQETIQQEQALRAASVAAQQEAEAAYQQIRQILESITDAFVSLDYDWRIVYQNAAGEQINGKARSEVLGKTHWEEWPASVGTNMELQYRRAIAEQVPVHFEHRYYSPPDYDTWLEIHAYPSERGLGIYYRDVTARKRMEQELRRREQEFSTLIENLPDVVFRLDRDLRHLYISPTVEQASSIPPQYFLGKTGREAGLPAHLCDLFEAECHKAIATGQVTEMEFSLGDRQYRSRIIPECAIDGSVDSLMGITEDITERKQAEAERDRLLELETAARAEAESANRVKDEFLAVLSHELRSPLNPIVGWSTLLRSRKLDEKTTAHALETIERSAKVQAQLIEDLLDISRILRGKLSLNVSSVNLVSTIQAAMETVRLAAQAKSIQIQTMFEPNIGQVSGDAGRLQQVIWNLLSNAVKFTPVGGRVDIRLECVGSQASITVSDTGKGINPDFLPYVFESFRQADATITRKFGGLGLGLAIVRQLVELHGGTVQANSLGEGEGATFTVRLPLMPTQSKMEQDSRQPKQIIDLNSVKVLVVDDDKNALEFVTFLLNLHGASVTAVTSAGEAFTALSQVKPDVLLSDIGMPDVDGYMLIRQVRTLPAEQGGQIPAIALTAYAGEINYQRALAAGFQRHVAKPVEPDKLIEVIGSLVSQQKRTLSNCIDKPGAEV